jgi:hypothetical protein
MIQNNLGKAYADLPTGNRAQNLKKAIACYESALKTWAPEAFPDDHELASDNLNRTRREPRAINSGGSNRQGCSLREDHHSGR